MLYLTVGVCWVILHLNRFRDLRPLQYQLLLLRSRRTAGGTRNVGAALRDIIALKRLLHWHSNLREPVVVHLVEVLSCMRAGQ